MRPVIYLSILNTFLLVPYFKMETNCSIKSCIHPGMWTTSLDLMDAYFHIPIAPPSQYSIPISNTPIRELNGFSSLHKSVSNSNSSYAHTVCSDSFLSRRFSDQGFRSTNSCFPSRNGNSAFSKSGVFDILEKVGVDSFSEFSVSRGTLQNRPGSHFSTRGKICIPLSENFVVPTLSS